MKVLNSGKALVLAVLAVFSLNFAYAQPANDACAGAINLTCGQTVTGNTATATNDVAPLCSGIAPQGKGVWYTITGTGGAITLSTCSTATLFDTQISVYSGACTALSCVAANYNDAACAQGGAYPAGRKSTVTFNSVFGTVYRILVAGTVSASGAFSLSVTCAVTAAPNDVCAGSVLLTCGQTVSGSTVGATVDAVGTCTTTLNSAPGVWYRVVGNGGMITVSTCNPGTNYDTKLGVFSGTCGALVCVGGNDDTTAPECVLPATGFNRKSRVAFSSVNGTTYHILVTGFSTLTGNFELSVTCATAPPPPPPVDNNACADATPIACGGTASGTTVGATIDGPAASCTGGSVAADRWYTIVGTGFSMTATTCTGTAYDSKLDIYTGACGSLVSVACNDDACGLQSTVTWPTVSGTTYRIRVHGFGGATGAYTLGVTCATSLVREQELPQINDMHQLQGEVNVSDFFPNPVVNGTTSIRIEAPVSGLAKINIVDNLGRAVRMVEQELYTGSNLVELNINDFATGTYFVSVQVGAKVMHRKLVVTKA